MARSSKIIRILAGMVLASAPREADATGTGLSDCPCSNPYTSIAATGISSFLVGNQLRYTPPGSSSSITFPPSYGNGCAAHDTRQDPHCSMSPSPAWCNVEWCYVEKDSCTAVSAIRSRFFPQTNLYFSYATCKSSGSPSPSGEWNNEDIEITRRLLGLTDQYARGARTTLENSFKNLDAGVKCNISVDRQACPCNSCFRSNAWNSKIDFEEVGTLPGPGGTEQERNVAACLANEVQSSYKTIAAQTADADFTKIGYIYFADAASGSLTQWPKEDTCNWQPNAGGGAFDPRYRDWYAAGATGPKDVVIVVDVSGSMQTNGRSAKAKEATKRIIDTLAWKDFANILLFNNGLSAMYATKMVAATEREKSNMKAWCDRQMWETGGTNFKIAFDKAFKVISDSVFAGHSSMCQKAILFLTDGEAPFEEHDFTFVEEKAQQYDTIVFTYALGSGADRTITKRLACENRGVFYPVSDGDNLGDIMAHYFEYFATGQEICQNSFAKYTTTSNTQVYGGCMPLYDRTHPMRSLLGVSCLDVSLVGDISQMKQQQGWDYFVCTASDLTKTCRSIDMSECHRQKVRLAYSAESVCEGRDHSNVSNATTCPCQDPNCQDEAGWTDEKHHFCDTWVGDDCNNIDAKWGYSEQGKADIRSKCRRSCGLCGWRDPCPEATAGECNVLPVPTECRACLGQTSGVDLEGREMACPADAPRNLMPTPAPPASKAWRRSGPLLVLKGVGGGAAAVAFFAALAALF